MLVGSSFSVFVLCLIQFASFEGVYGELWRRLQGARWMLHGVYGFYTDGGFDGFTRDSSDLWRKLSKIFKIQDSQSLG